MLAEKLNMKPEEAECWIVNLIRNARLDAKIDSKLGHVVMGTQPLSPYQQLIEKIDSLSVRSEALQNLIERKLKARTQDVSNYFCNCCSAATVILKITFIIHPVVCYLFRIMGQESHPAWGCREHGHPSGCNNGTRTTSWVSSIIVIN